MDAEFCWTFPSLAESTSDCSDLRTGSGRESAACITARVLIRQGQFWSSEVEVVRVIYGLSLSVHTECFVGGSCVSVKPTTDLSRLTAFPMSFGTTGFYLYNSMLFLSLSFLAGDHGWSVRHFGLRTNWKSWLRVPVWGRSPHMCHLFP